MKERNTFIIYSSGLKKAKHDISFTAVHKLFERLNPVVRSLLHHGMKVNNDTFLGFESGKGVLEHFSKTNLRYSGVSIVCFKTVEFLL